MKSPFPIRLACACLACVPLFACGRTDSPPPPDILKVQREAMDKAKGTEKTLQDAAQRRDAQGESDTQPKPASTGY